MGPSASATTSGVDVTVAPPDVRGAAVAGASAAAAALGSPIVPDPGAGNGPDWLDDFLADNLPALVTFRRRVHARPELSHAEHGTTARLRDTLAAAGIAATVLPSGTGLVGEIGTGDRVVGLRADIDALPLTEATDLPYSSAVPGVAHSCGHDVHLTVLLGAALALKSAGQLPGRVRLLFQPAEEVMPGGGHELVETGAVDGLAQVFALHCDPRLPVGRVGLRVGPITSTCDLIDLTVTGSGGHTSRPQLTADVVGALGLVVTQLPPLLARRLDPRSGAVLVWGAIRSGEAPNAIPQSGVLRGTLRIMDRAAWDQAEDLVTELIAQILAPTGATHTLNYVRGVPPVVNDAEAVALLQQGVSAALGGDAVAVAEQLTGAEDFAMLLEEAPGALARLGVWDGVRPQADLHSPGFVADERAIPVGIRTLVHTTLAALTNG